MVPKRAVLAIKNHMVLIIVALFCFIAIGSLFAYLYDRQPISGDAPHYLVMSNSLVNDHDLNLKNDYTEMRYLNFYGLGLDYHINFGLVKPESDKWYSIHSPGLPIVLAPIFALGHVKAATLFMIMIGVLLCVLVYLWCMELTKHRLASVVSTLVLFGSIMYLNLVGHVFVDMVIAALLVAILLLIEKCRRTPNRWLYGLIGILAGYAIWIHVKTELVVATCIVLAILQIVRNRKDKAWKTKLGFLLVPFGLIVALFCYKIHTWFGVWIPNEIYSGNNQLFQLSPLVGLPAILFDSFKGIFVSNPAFLLLFSGLPAWWRNNKHSLIMVLLVVIPSFVIQSTFNDWAGGWSPTGRYPMEYLPLFIPAIAFSLIYLRKTLARIVQVLLIATQVGFSVLFIYLKIPWVMAGEGTPLFKYLQIDWIVPHFNGLAQPIGTTFYKYWIMIAIAVALFGYGYYATRITQKRSKN